MWQHGVRWRHRFLAAARGGSGVLKGIVEADETAGEPEGHEAGAQGADRGLSREQAGSHGGGPWRDASAVLPSDAGAHGALDRWSPGALLVSDGGASYPPCAAALGVSHESLNRSMGERVRGDLHVQTVNSRHSRWKDFLRPRASPPAIWTTIWRFHLVGLAPGANDRSCLAAAVMK